MEADLGAYLEWLEAHGVQFAVAADLRHDPDHDGRLVAEGADTRTFALDGLPSIEEVRDPHAGLAADHATEMVARCLLHPSVRVGGARFADVGCGTGVLAALGGRVGAAAVHGTDIDAAALALAEATCRGADVDADLRLGPLLAPLEGVALDVVVANLPHKPCPDDYALPTSQHGGPSGEEPHQALVPQLLERLAPDGRVLFFLHSLPGPGLLRRYAEDFDLTLLAWKRRFFQPHEYGALMDVFMERSAAGRSLVLDGGGRHRLVAGAWLATRR